MHVNGELSLIMSRPPGSFVKGYSHQLFVDGRRHLVSRDISHEDPIQADALSFLPSDLR